MRRSDSRGFTLIELIFATALTTGAVLAIATMSLTAYDRVNRSGQTRQALTIAQQHLETLRSDSYESLTAGTTVVPLSGLHEGYTRTVTITDDTPQPGIKQITVAVGTPRGRTVQLASLVAE